MFTIEEVKKGKFRIVSHHVKPPVHTIRNRKLSFTTPEPEEESMSSFFSNLKSEVMGAIAENMEGMNARMAKVEKSAK